MNTEDRLKHADSRICRLEIACAVEGVLLCATIIGLLISLSSSGGIASKPPVTAEKSSTAEKIPANHVHATEVTANVGHFKILEVEQTLHICFPYDKNYSQWLTPTTNRFLRNGENRVVIGNLYTGDGSGLFSNDANGKMRINLATHDKSDSAEQVFADKNSQKPRIIIGADVDRFLRQIFVDRDGNCESFPP